MVETDRHRFFPLQLHGSFRNLNLVQIHCYCAMKVRRFPVLINSSAALLSTTYRHLNSEAVLVLQYPLFNLSLFSNSFHYLDL